MPNVFASDPEVQKITKVLKRINRAPFWINAKTLDRAISKNINELYNAGISPDSMAKYMSSNTLSQYLLWMFTNGANMETVVSYLSAHDLIENFSILSQKLGLDTESLVYLMESRDVARYREKLSAAGVSDQLLDLCINKDINCRHTQVRNP